MENLCFIEKSLQFSKLRTSPWDVLILLLLCSLLAGAFILFPTGSTPFPGSILIPTVLSLSLSLSLSPLHTAPSWTRRSCPGLRQQAGRIQAVAATARRVGSAERATAGRVRALGLGRRLAQAAAVRASRRARAEAAAGAGASEGLARGSGSAGRVGGAEVGTAWTVRAGRRRDARARASAWAVGRRWRAAREQAQARVE
jgi:hypothetical protein